MITAIVIPADPEEPLRLEQIDEHDFDAYRRLVEGRFEVLDINRPPASLYFNAENKILEMPVNPRATALLWVHRSAFRGLDVIAGPAFILGRPDPEGTRQTAPQDLIDLLFNTNLYRVQVMTLDNTGWSGNRLVFTTWFDAYIYAIDLAQRWTLVEEARVVPVLDVELRKTWYQLGLNNRAIRMADDPPFTMGRFIGCFSIEELAERISKNPWAVGTALYYRDLCFIQQIPGGDKWLTIRHGIAFESMSLLSHIANGTFASLVRRLLAASKEQLQQRE